MKTSNSQSNGHFYSPSRGRVSVSKMVSEISYFVEENPDGYYRLVIGTDSQLKHTNGHTECDFVTAIVIHRVGNGARYFWHKDKRPQKFMLRDKIYTETMLSLEMARKILPIIQENIYSTKYDLEIHIDVGAHGPTREMLKEVVGMVNGNGFVAKTKPESWAASSVADRYT